MGVAVSVRTWTSARRFLTALLLGHSEALLLVDDDEAQILELDALGEDRVGAITMSTWPDATASFVSFASLALTKRERRPIRIGSRGIAR
jgi:hypothetical protein